MICSPRLERLIINTEHGLPSKPSVFSCFKQLCEAKKDQVETTTIYNFSVLYETNNKNRSPRE